MTGCARDGVRCAYDDLQNVLSVTGDAFLFLDADLRLRRFSERAHALAGILDEDVGKFVARLSLRVPGADLARDAQRALTREEMVESEAQSEDGRWIHLRYRPYRLAREEAVSGVVVALTDVTEYEPKQTQRPIQPRFAEQPPAGEQRGQQYPDDLEEFEVDFGDVEGTTYRASTGQGFQPHLRATPARIEEEETLVVLKRRVQEQAHEIRRLGSELNRVEQQERARLAQILHDEFQQLLYALKIRLDAVSTGASMEVHGERIRELVEQASALTGTLVVSLAPPIYESDDLGATLEWLADYVDDRYGVQVAVHYDPPLPVCGEEQRVLLFEIARELLFNVVKHAEVDRARLTVLQKTSRLVVVVEDEGRGFDGAATAQEYRRGGFGLQQIRRRLRLLGGELEIESVPGVGTRASAAVPL